MAAIDPKRPDATDRFRELGGKPGKLYG